MIGLIVGSGFEDLVMERKVVKTVETDWGSAEVECGEWNGVPVAIVFRHARDHRWAPHKVPARAQIAALKALGVKKVFATATVGGLSADNAPGHITVPDQVIDYTTGRENTFWDEAHPEVLHVDFSEPFTESLRQVLLEAAKRERVFVFNKGVYGCTQGPRLETAAEIRRLIMDGCTMVGMTVMPEAGLAREAQLHYAVLTASVNWGAGLVDKALDFEVISQTQKTVSATMRRILAAAVKDASHG